MGGRRWVGAATSYCVKGPENEVSVQPNRPPAQPIGLPCSSSVISGLLGALIVVWFNLRAKHTEYANTYYKMVLEKRIKAYEAVERLTKQIKIAPMFEIFLQRWSAVFLGDPQSLKVA